MEHDVWKALFQGFKSRAADEEERARKERELDGWYEEQAKRVMNLVRDVASERAEQFARETGMHIDVKWPSHPPVNASPEGPFMSFMSLSLGAREVHLYSHRMPKQAPVIHYVLLGHDPSGRHRPKLESRAGCRIDPRPQGGFRLVDLRDGKGAEEIGVDDIAFRAFEILLVGG